MLTAAQHLMQLALETYVLESKLIKINGSQTIPIYDYSKIEKDLQNSLKIILSYLLLELIVMHISPNQ